MTSKLTREKLRALAVKKVKSLKFAITQSAFTNIRRNLEDELQLAEFRTGRNGQRAGGLHLQAPSRKVILGADR
ncbi:CPS-53 (KpLE1) prophage protein [Escherichia coli]|nr:CPS-53 (KpLE1) prophage protein [Escherichia coli]